MPTLDFSADGIAAIERRTHPRAAFRQQLTFEYYSEDGQKLGFGFGVASNISAGGMLFETDKWLGPPLRLLVEIISPLYMFMATAHVVHSREVSETLYQVGVRFDDFIQSEWEVGAGAKP